MKAEILKILQMQQEGKLTQDQAAELLAILADQAREKTAQTDPLPQDPTAGQGGAPGPRGGTEGKKGPKGRGFVQASTAAIHGLVDTAVGVGTTIGRAATVIGGEVAEMVHRDEGGNSVTLSSVDVPVGEGYVFKGNTINVSKVSALNLHAGELCGNTINASKINHLGVTRGRFAQCNVSGSSLSHVTISGPDNPPADSTALSTATEPAATAGIRGVTFNATKFSRVSLTGESSLEVSTVQASSVKELDLAATRVRDAKFNDVAINGMTLEGSVLRGVTIERSHVHMFNVSGTTLEDVRLSGVKADEVKIAGGTWKDVTFRREAAGIGGRECLLSESAFEDCAFSACDFAGCTFKRSTLRKLKLSGMTVRNVDFTGLTIETEADFRRVAGV